MTENRSSGTRFQRLRETAERLLEKKGVGKPDIEQEEFLRLAHELEVRHVELEVQNEELRRTKQEAETAQERFFDLYDSAPVAYVTLNAEGVIERANRAAFRLFGIDSEPLEGKTFASLIYSQDNFQFQLYVKQLIEDGQAGPLELRLRGKEEPIYVYLEGTADIDEEKGIRQFHLAIMDITERKQTEEALKSAKFHAEAERRRLETVLQVLPVGVVITDGQGGVLLSNKKDAEIWGLHPRTASIGDYTQYKAWWVDSGRPVEPDEWASAQAIRDGKSVIGQVMEIQRFDGRRGYVHNSAVPIYDEEGRNIGSVVAIQDITALRETENALQQLNQNLEKRIAERTAELEKRSVQLVRLTSELTLAEQRERRRIAEILHNHLQQLLVAAKMGQEILIMQADTALKPAAKNVLDLINRSIKASRSLTAELSPAVLRSGDLSRSLEWLAQWMHENQRFEVDVKTEPGVVLAQKDLTVLLFHSVREMLFNVVKHAGVKSARVEMSCDVKSRLRISVIDQGAGFDPDIIWKKAEEGSGLGLFSIRERMTLFGGSLEAESSPGEGACFSLVVPVEIIKKNDFKRIKKKIS